MVDQVYDMYHQWIGCIVNPDGNQGSAATQATYFAYDQGQIVLECEGSTADDLLTRYLWSPAVDRLLAEEAHVKQGINSGDITFAFQAGEYDDGDNNNSGWAEGDWNGDFDSSDFSFAFGEGGYDRPNRGGGAFAVHQTIIGYTGRPLDLVTGVQRWRKRERPSLVCSLWPLSPSLLGERGRG